MKLRMSDHKDTSMEEAISSFEPQYRENDCFPTCIRNMLRELSIRHGHGKNPFKLSKSKINDQCDYDSHRASSADMRSIKQRLDKEIKTKGFRCLFQYTDSTKNPQLNVGELRDIIGSNRKSYPTVTLSPDYYKDSKVPFKADIRFGFAHTVIVLRVENDNIFLWDGLLSYKFSTVDTRSIVNLPMERFIKYWTNVDRSKETCWIELETKKQVMDY